MKSVFLARGAYQDHWLDIDSVFEIQGGVSRVTVQVYLPQTENAKDSAKLVSLLTSDSCITAEVARNRSTMIDINLDRSSSSKVRVLAEFPEAANDRRRLGVKLIAVIDAVTGESLEISVSPNENKDTTAPLPPDYWAVARELNRDFYLHQLEGTEVFHEPIVHYLAFGWQKNISPSPQFDVAHYMGQLSSPVVLMGRSPFAHYITDGRLKGLTGCISEQKISLAPEAGIDQIWHDGWIHRIGDLLSAIGIKSSFRDDDLFSRYVVWMFDPESYRHRNALGEHVTPVELFTRYFLLDYPQGVPPGPLFQPGYYLEQLQERGLRIEGAEPPFRHWLRVGVWQRISPTPLFAESEYLLLNQDLNGYPNWVFEHWLGHGLAEGRLFDRNFRIARNRKWSPEVSQDLPSLSFVRFASRKDKLVNELLDIRRFRKSVEFAQLVEAASNIDPNIPELPTDTLSLLPPFHDEEYAGFRSLLEEIGNAKFDAVVLMPFCKMGGADFVAGVLAKSLVRLGKRTVVLRTDADSWERPDWFPDECKSFDLSTELGKMPEHLRIRALYEVIRFLEVKFVFNVNSRLAFDMISGFGQRLALLANIYCYYFCADRTETGKEVGYPIWYFASILPNLSGAMLDTAYLANVLSERHSLSSAQKAKLKVMYTPVMGAHKTAPVVLEQISSKASRARPVVFWAGRLDRQKRFDLVIAIAKAMPEADFHCWGKAVLDAPPDLNDLPTNMTMHEPFKSFEELPLADSDLWLYTSAWDGLPTILIEIAQFGVPIVASGVGGVPELINEKTGWLMAESATTDDYVETVRKVLSDNEARSQRAQMLQEYVSMRNSVETYEATLHEVLRIQDVTM